MESLGLPFATDDMMGEIGFVRVGVNVYVSGEVGLVCFDKRKVKMERRLRTKILSEDRVLFF